MTKNIAECRYFIESLNRFGIDIDDLLKRDENYIENVLKPLVEFIMVESANTNGIIYKSLDNSFDTYTEFDILYDFYLNFYSVLASISDEFLTTYFNCEKKLVFSLLLYCRNAVTLIKIMAQIRPASERFLVQQRLNLFLLRFNKSHNPIENWDESKSLLEYTNYIHKSNLLKFISRHAMSHEDMSTVNFVEEFFMALTYNISYFDSIKLASELESLVSTYYFNNVLKDEVRAENIKHYHLYKPIMRLKDIENGIKMDKIVESSNGMLHYPLLEIPSIHVVFMLSECLNKCFQIQINQT